VQLRFRLGFDLHIAIICALFGTALFLIILSPFLVPAGQLDDLSGSVLTVDNLDKIDGINPVAWLVYWMGDINCHQLKERSYFLNDNQMPFCARDVGIFAGAVIGFVIALFIVIPMRWQWLLILVIPLVVDAALQELTAYESTNEIRFITGIIAAAAGAIFISNLIAVPKKEIVSEPTDDA